MTTNAKDFEITFYEGIVRRNPDYIDALIPLAEIYTRKGLYEKGLEIDKRLARLCKEDPVVHYNLACSLALVGKKKEAVETLRKAVNLGYREFDHMLRDADLKPLHGYPAFEKLLKEAIL
jgi:tetratricopeptide (TPR) repeat protein